MKELTQKRLKEVLHYDPSTGDFTWRIKVNRNIRIGSLAGTILTSKGKNYIRIGIDKIIYYAHRLAFLYMTGKWPDPETDHEDGNGLHNWWSNLSEATRLENGKNIRIKSNNTSGCAGIVWHKTIKKWEARIKINRKQIYLGVFIDKGEAIKTRKTAEIKYGFHPNHGSTRPL